MHWSTQDSAGAQKLGGLLPSSRLVTALQQRATATGKLTYAHLVPVSEGVCKRRFRAQ